jgi:hypothetical protein
MPTDPHLDVSEAVRVQILATEHWSLLAARNITYGAIYSRATIFLTVVSAAVVALALAAEATEFGDRFYVFALLVLPVAFFIGLGTYIRLVDARIEDFWLSLEVPVVENDAPVPPPDHRALGSFPWAGSLREPLLAWDAYLPSGTSPAEYFGGNLDVWLPAKETRLHTSHLPPLPPRSRCGRSHRCRPDETHSHH